MNNVLTKKLMVKRLTGKCGLTKPQANEVIEDLFSCFSEALEHGHSVILQSIGTLKVKLSPAKDLKLRHFEGKVPDRYKVKFVQSPKLVISAPKEPEKPSEK